MSATEFYRLTKMPLASVIARAKEDGWYEGADDDPNYDGLPLIEYAINYEEHEDFKSYRLARKAALKACKEDFWGSARVYDCWRDEHGQTECSDNFQEFGKGDKRPWRPNA